jgi:hypothetical protein
MLSEAKDLVILSEAKDLQTGLSDYCKSFKSRFFAALRMTGVAL